ncbi:unnamed protein product, partial [Prorocentrum cordatum]
VCGVLSSFYRLIDSILGSLAVEWRGALTAASGPASDLRDAGPGRQGEDPRGRIPHPRMRRHLGGQGQPRGMRLCAAANGRGQGPDLPAIACELLDECLTADPQKTCGRGADNMTLVLVQLRDTIPPIRPSKRRAPAQSCFGAQAD